MLHSNSYKPVKILANTYCYFWRGKGNNCNSYLLTDILPGEHPHVIIDPGSIINEFREPCLEQLLAAIKADGIKDEEIGIIINTHSHPDHCAASEALAQRTRGKESPLIAFSKEEYEFFLATGEKFFALLGTEPPKIDPYFLLGEGTLKLGNITLQVLHTPGHSPGSLCFYWPEKKVLFSGDVAFYGSIGRTDFPGGSLSAMEKSIEKLSALEVEYLLPGHSTEYGSFIHGQNEIKRNFQMLRMFF